MKKILLIPFFALFLSFAWIPSIALAGVCIGTAAECQQAAANSSGIQTITGTDVTNSNASGASTTFQPLTNVEGTPFAAMFGANATLTGFFQGLFNVSITIGALLAVLMLAWGGYEFLFSDIVDKRGKAKSRIQNALLGLLMLLATVLILRQINPDIVSLRILSNQGSNVTSSQRTGTTASANGFTDSGTQMTTPQGYCVNQGPVNVGLSSANYYQCYSTLAACGQVHGINNCAAYSTSQDSTYSSGTGNGLASPTTAADYMTYHWCPAGTSTSACNSGSGWAAISADYCGAGASAGNGTCYGLQKPVAYANVAAIPDGNWCYSSATQGTNPGYNCSSDQNICKSEQAAAVAESGPTGTCAQKTSSGLSAVSAQTYSKYAYATKLQVDGSGVTAANACGKLFPGYQAVALNACPASANANGATTGQCCALPATTASASTPNETAYPDSASLTSAPAGSYCYQISTGKVYCSLGTAACTTNINARKAANPSDPIASGCQAVN